MIEALGIIAGLAGLALTIRIGRGLFRGALGGPQPCLPRWLEDGMPLKGRWLRYFLGAPALILVLALVWLGLSGILFVLLLLPAVTLGLVR